MNHPCRERRRRPESKTADRVGGCQTSGQFRHIDTPRVGAHVGSDTDGHIDAEIDGAGSDSAPVRCPYTRDLFGYAP